MASEKDTVLGRLAVERGYATQQQVDEAFAAQKAAAEAAGVTMPLAQVLVGKEMLTRDQAQELVNAVAVETGEARLVAGYEVISKLGQGGMGAVYKAKRPTTGQYVALKVLPPSLATDELVKRFRREAEIVRKLQHDNIVGCVEFGFDKRRKVHFCALELVEGEDLARRIKRLSRLTEDEAVSITVQIAKALQHAYANGLVHRDVKPENVMVTSDGTAKLLDLGLARPADSEATRMTQSGMFVGSPYYASPEQALAERDIDIRSDIYSLGATLYHMVTGRPPFEGGTALAILQKHVAEKLPWPAEVNPELSDGLCRIIAKMMEKAPDDRYRTPNDLHGDLDLLGGGKEPEVDVAALKNSSVKVPAVRPARRRRPDSRARMAPGRERAAARRPDRRRRDSARERRRGAEGGPRPGEKASRWAALPAGAKIAMGAGALGLMIAVGLVMFFGGDGPDQRPPKRGDSEGTLRTQPDKVTPESVPPRADRPSDEARKVSPPGRTAADAGKAEPAQTLTFNLGGGVTMEFIYIKPGVFMMGGTADIDPNHLWQGIEKPKHEVAITRGFYIGKYEVTQSQYEAVTGGNPSKWKEPSRPVEQVTWHEAAEFCRLATERTGRQFRLPAEAEWEYACRAGTTGKWHCGNDWRGLGDYAWYVNNSGRHTHPVGLKKPNAWGLHDMHGNVKEWVADRYAPDYYAKSPREDPIGPDAGNRRLLRGGAWGGYGGHCRSAIRDRSAPSSRHANRGFRAVVSASPPGPRPAARPPNVPPDAVEFGGHWYKLCKERVTWHDAKARCEKQGGHLVTITSKEEQDFVTDLARRVGQSVWIGFTDEKLEGRWEWVTGEKVTFVAWFGGEPDNRAGGQDCAILWPSDGYAWHDVIGGFSTFLICEWEPGWKPSAMPRAVKAAASAKPYPNEPDSLRVGLVGHWTFDDGTGATARDSSGRGNHGRIDGARWLKGRHGGALQYDGKDDYVAWRSADMRQATIAAWFMADPAGKGYGPRIVGMPAYELYVTSSADIGKSIGFVVNLVEGFEAWNVSGVTVRPGRWHHIAVAHDPRFRDNRPSIFIDGSKVGVVLKKSSNRTSTLVSNAGAACIGNRGRKDRSWHGLIDDVRIYNRALSPEEIRLLAHPEEWIDARAGPAASRPSRGPPPTEKPTALLVTGQAGQVGNDAVAARLRASGWTVVGKTDKQVTEADAVGKGLILISSTCGSHNIGAKFTKVPVPLIVWETWCLDDLGMTGGTRGEDYDYDKEMTAVVMSSRGHPLAAGLDGEITIYAKPGGMAWGGPGKNAIIAATLPGRPTRAALFAYEAGARMPGLVAPARRLSIFLSDTEASTLTEHGWRLFDAAVKWASGRDERQGRRSTHRPAMQEQALLAEFDRLVQRGDHAAARAHVEAEAAKPENRTHARLLEAAARVAKALGDRDEAVRRAARALVGKDTELATTKGTLSGKVARVTDDGTVLLIKKRLRGGQGVIETRMTVKWSDLVPETEDRLAKAGGWRAERAEGAMAETILAFSRKDETAAKAALARAGDHPLAAYYHVRRDAARRQAAYDVAMRRARSLARRRSWKAATQACEAVLRLRPDDAEAAKLLAEAESHLPPPPTLTLDLGGVTMEMIYIKPGVFMMGSNETPPGWGGVEGPVHEVEITRGFYVGKYEVTRGQFAAFVKATGYRTEAEKEGKAHVRHPDGSWKDTPGAGWQNPIFTQADDHPVVCVTWNDARAFCEWAAAKTRRAVRLPSEAEWEYACRAGSTGRWSHGDDESRLGEYAWYDQNSGMRTHPVGQKKPNAWGLHDVHGNVWEWVADRYDPGYYARSPREDPAGPDVGGDPARRGGCWHDGGADSRAALRRLRRTSDRNAAIGFRVAASASHRVSASAQAAYGSAMARAKMRLQFRNWKGALEACEEALEAKPGDAEAKRLLAEAQSHLGPPKTLTLDLGRGVKMEMVYIKPGVFAMGGTEDPKHNWHGVEKPRHEVAITRGFYIGRYEVTRGQFAAFVKATGYRTEAEKEGKAWTRHPDGWWRYTAGVSWLDPKFFTQADDHPVVAVSWNDVKTFCDWAAAKTRRDVRLPTEAEWEFAARAGSTTRFCFGDSHGGLGEYAWYRDNSGMQTHPVGQKRANAWGLHDVHGNVWEWVADWYDAGFYAKSPRKNPTGPDSGRDRLLRGGGWRFRGR